MQQQQQQKRGDEVPTSGLDALAALAMNTSSAYITPNNNSSGNKPYSTSYSTTSTTTSSASTSTTAASAIASSMSAATAAPTPRSVAPKGPGHNFYLPEEGETNKQTSHHTAGQPKVSSITSHHLAYPPVQNLLSKNPAARNSVHSSSLPHAHTAAPAPPAKNSNPAITTSSTASIGGERGVMPLTGYNHNPASTPAQPPAPAAHHAAPNNTPPSGQGQGQDNGNSTNNATITISASAIRKEQRKQFMATKTLQDVVYDDANLVQLGSNQEHTTALQSIGGISPNNIHVEILRRFCSRNHISGWKSGSKVTLCNLIVNAVKNNEHSASKNPVAIATAGTDIPPATSIAAAFMSSSSSSSSYPTSAPLATAVIDHDNTSTKQAHHTNCDNTSNSSSTYALSPTEADDTTITATSRATCAPAATTTPITVPRPVAVTKDGSICRMIQVYFDKEMYGFVRKLSRASCTSQHTETWAKAKELYNDTSHCRPQFSRLDPNSKYSDLLIQQGMCPSQYDVLSSAEECCQLIEYIHDKLRERMTVCVEAGNELFSYVFPSYVGNYPWLLLYWEYLVNAPIELKELAYMKVGVITGGNTGTKIVGRGPASSSLSSSTIMNTTAEAPSGGYVPRSHPPASFPAAPVPPPVPTPPAQSPPLLSTTAMGATGTTRVAVVSQSPPPPATVLEQKKRKRTDQYHFENSQSRMKEYAAATGMMMAGNQVQIAAGGAPLYSSGASSRIGFNNNDMSRAPPPKRYYVGQHQYDYNHNNVNNESKTRTNVSQEIAKAGGGTFPGSIAQHNHKEKPIINKTVDQSKSKHSDVEMQHSGFTGPKQSGQHVSGRPSGGHLPGSNHNKNNPSTNAVNEVHRQHPTNVDNNNSRGATTARIGSNNANAGNGDSHTRMVSLQQAKKLRVDYHNSLMDLHDKATERIRRTRQLLKDAERRKKKQKTKLSRQDDQDEGDNRSNSSNDYDSDSSDFIEELKEDMTEFKRQKKEALEALKESSVLSLPSVDFDNGESYNNAAHRICRRNAATRTHNVEEVGVSVVSKTNHSSSNRMYEENNDNGCRTTSSPPPPFYAAGGGALTGPGIVNKSSNAVCDTSATVSSTGSSSGASVHDSTATMTDEVNTAANAAKVVNTNMLDR